MVHVISFISRLTPTSIPLEIAASTETGTEVDVTVVSFYDKTTATDYDVPVVALGANSRFDVGAFRRLWKLLRRENIDVLHTHHNFIGSVARILGTLANVSNVDPEHRQHDSITSLQIAVNAPTLPLADRVVANSKATERSFYFPERLLLNSDQLKVVYNGIDIDRIEAATNTGEIPHEADGPQIVTVGRLVDVKNQDLLLRAFASVTEQVPDATLVVVGDGPRRSELEELAESLGVDERVTFLGEISREEVYCQLVASDVFAISSSAEGFCVAAVEAMACGLPVVATDIPVFHEIVGDCGWFTDQDSPSSFARVLTDLCTDSQKQRAVGSAAEDRAKSAFPLTRTVEEYCKIYKDVAETSNQ